MKIRYILLGAILITQACSNENVKPENKPNLRTLTSDEVQVSKSNADFSFNIFRETLELGGDNVFISPISISTALGMTLNGAEGDTKNGILKTIDYAELTPTDVNEGYRGLSTLLASMDNTVKLNLANSVWYRNTLTINPDFEKVVTSYYNGKAEGLDFSAADQAKETINNWVDVNTNHKIKNIIEAVPANAVMYLVNATYFKGTWLYTFDKSLTHKEDFYADDGAVEVDMMTSKDAEYNALANDSLIVVDIPYGNGQFSMTVLMPAIGKPLDNITEGLTATTLTNILASTSPHKMTLRFPKFKMTWKNKLNTPLSNLGMSVAFSDNASFPYLFVEKPTLSISEVIHQSSIEVNEEGTEAAAATSVGVVFTSVGPLENLVINRPFVFIIREKHTNAILFVGQLANPGSL